MKITSKFVNIKSYEITEEEAKLIKHCLQYCVHRLTSHLRKGIHQVANAKGVMNLLEEFNK